MKQSPILIIGKNGKTGLRVNKQLQTLGFETRAVSRSTSPAFDWENSDTWRSAIEGTHSAYVTYQPDLAVPNAEAAITEFVRQAKDAGLHHIVLLSGRGEEGAQRAEKILQNSGIAWNIEQGVPEDMQWLLRELFTEVLDGRNTKVMSGVEEALGRPATDFKTYIEKAIQSGVWNPLIQKKSA
ncbi:putative oxidoreductase YesF [Nymphon striatum]|nr:putative oxidoreductase YesF [Nymphon striatum]